MIHSKVDINQLAEHVRKAQFLMLATFLTIFMVSFVKPNASEELEQLNLFETVLKAFDGRWLDHELRDLKIDRVRLDEDIIVEGIRYRSPVGYPLSRSIDDYWVKRMPASFHAFVHGGAYSIYSSRGINRGLPPFLLDDASIFRETKVERPNFESLKPDVTLGDILTFLELFSESVPIHFVETYGEIYVEDANGTFELEIVNSRQRKKLRKAERQDQDVTTTFGDALGMFHINDTWNLKQENRYLRSSRANHLIESSNKQFYLIPTVREKRLDFNRVFSKAAKSAGVRFHGSPKSRFSFLVEEAKDNPALTVREFKNAILRVEKDQSRAISADILGIKVTGWTIWWILPLVALAAQAYFWVLFVGLSNALKRGMILKFPLGLLFPGKWVAALAFGALFVFPACALILNLILVYNSDFYDWKTVAVNFGALLIQGLNWYLIFEYLAKDRRLGKPGAQK